MGAALPLTLGILEALAGARLAVLLALLLPRVPREEAGALERRTTLGIRRAQRARDAVPHRLCLRAVPTTSHRGAHVVLVEQLQQLERLAHHHLVRLANEVLVRRPSVHRDLAGARR